MALPSAWRCPLHGVALCMKSAPHSCAWRLLLPMPHLRDAPPPSAELRGMQLCWVGQRWPCLPASRIPEFCPTSLHPPAPRAATPGAADALAGAGLKGEAALLSWAEVALSACQSDRAPPNPSSGGPSDNHEAQTPCEPYFVSLPRAFLLTSVQSQL